MRRWECIDANNEPIAWYTYPAIEYIRQLDFTDKVVFEYGSGNSTLFWQKRCREVIAAEDNEEWYNRIKAKLPDDVKYNLLVDQNEYVNSINNYATQFDIIIIDGSHRYQCAEAALENLKDDGIIILDNSDWYEKTSERLRAAGLIEVDMTGFGPINGYTWTTSFYFRRNVQLKPAHDRQPLHGIGSLPQTEF
jgi:precorrin-6B methylase 2